MNYVSVEAKQDNGTEYVFLSWRKGRVTFDSTPLFKRTQMDLFHFSEQSKEMMSFYLLIPPN